MVVRYLLAVISTAAILLVAGCGDETSGGEDQVQTDELGYPVDEEGNVSSNPDDYREILCDTPAFENDPEC